MRADNPTSRGPNAAPVSPTTPEDFVDTIRQLYQRLAAAPTLRPSSQVDLLFRQLVGLVVGAPPRNMWAVLADPAIQAIRPHLLEICALGEYELEDAWAGRITSGQEPHETLRRFPYLDNYHQLTRLEAGTIRPHLDWPLRRALFVGSGPLPLSSLLLSRQLDIPFDNLDHDRTAVHTARAVADRLDAGNLAFGHGDLVACQDLTHYDLIVLAALVGLDAAQKRRNLRQILDLMAPGALLLARSAHGLRTLLYPAVGPADLAPSEPLAVIHPTGTVINSVILTRKPRVG